MSIAGTTPSVLKVLTLNMQFGQGWSDSDPDGVAPDIDASIAAIRERDADIVFLQEVEQVRPQGEQIDPPPNYSRLREALAGYQSCFAYPPADCTELPFGYGLAIFSKGPLDCVERLVLPAPDIEFEFDGVLHHPTQRIALSAQTEFCGRRLQLWNAHLQAFFMIGSTADAHPAQRCLLMDRVRQSHYPVLLAGDFNCAPEEGTVGQIKTLGLAPLQESEPTWKRRPYVLDHIFTNGALVPLASHVIETDVSDHRMLMGMYALKP